MTRPSAPFFELGAIFTSPRASLSYLAAGVVTLTLVAVAWRFGFALSA